MSEENIESPSVKNKQPINELLMKPFSLGWTREVVRRVVTHNGTPNCDIYYFSPSKKKLRSLIEVKSNLSDGLSPECFSFKREPLGLSPDMETVRDAKFRGKTMEKSKEKIQSYNNLRNQNKSKKSEQEIIQNEVETEIEKPKEEESNAAPEIVENGENAESTDATNSKEKFGVKDILEKEPEVKSKRAKSVSSDIKNSKNINSIKNTKTKAKSTKPVKMQSVKKRKTVLKKVMNAKKAKQARVVPSRKIVKQIVKKKVISQKQKLSKTQRNKKSGLKSNMGKTLKLKAEKKSVKNNLTKGKNEVMKKPEANESDKKTSPRDLKSIVKKNIGKYREMREKEKLGVGKTPMSRSPSRKLTVATVSKSRSEPISKNKMFYLKPLEKGWRRELVYRTNCAKAGQKADVYYFHPSGKKLRSCREVAENLTHGLSIECFTFRKEAIGCGEPSEVIRNARYIQKN